MASVLEAGGSRYFYPRSPCGERPVLAVTSEVSDKISIHALLAESDRSNQSIISQADNFYPRSPCGERRLIEFRKLLYPDFYPRSPCGERLMDTLILTNAMLFLSTLSLRRATIMFTGILAHHAHFYPRSPCGERPASSTEATKSGQISIHALLAESDSAPRFTPTTSRNFYPRSPCGERPQDQYRQ